VTVSVGGEIGEVGGKNSTVEELHAFMEGYLETLRKNGAALKGISKISVQTGTTHGGIPMADGSVAKVKLDFDTLQKISAVARTDYGMAGAVQHGASTLPNEAFDRFPATGTAEIHLATGFQNIVYDSPSFPAELRERIYGYLKKEAASERKEGDTEEQFFYKTRKKGVGPFKREMWDLPEAVRAELGRELEAQFALLFRKLNVGKTMETVPRTVRIARVIGKRGDRKICSLFCFFQWILAPAFGGRSKPRSVSPPSASVASSIPRDSIPISFAGLRLATTTMVLPTISSGV